MLMCEPLEALDRTGGRAQDMRRLEDRETVGHLNLPCAVLSAGHRRPSRHVEGAYMNVRRFGDDCWSYNNVK